MRTSFDCTCLGAVHDPASLICSGSYHRHYGDLTYSVSNGEVTITDYDYYVTSVTIPNTIDSYPVTGDADFDGNGALTEDDAVYLLLHVLFGEETYPLKKQ